jgi:hypothetical protein
VRCSDNYAAHLTSQTSLLQLHTRERGAQHSRHVTTQFSAITNRLHSVREQPTTTEFYCFHQLVRLLLLLQSLSAESNKYNFVGYFQRLLTGQGWP